MSHFIKGADHLQSDLTISFTPTLIIDPVISHRGKSKAQFIKDGRILREVCGPLKILEEERIRRQTQQAIGIKRDSLKKKFRSYFNPKANGRSVSDFFQDKTGGCTIRQSICGQSRLPLNLKNLSQKMPIRLELERKYNSAISIKMMTINECRQLQNLKQKAKQSKQNDLTQSPNYCKMIYVIQKLKEKSDQSDVFASIGQSRVKTSDNMWLKKIDNRLAYRAKSKKTLNLKTAPDSPKGSILPFYI